MILSFVNQKGGVAKTTSCLNIGAALTLKGKRVLLIDLDPQGSLTRAAGITGVNKLPTIYEVLKSEAGLEDSAVGLKDTIQTAQGGYDVAPTDIRMSGAEIELIGVPGRDSLLKTAVEPLQDAYDFILIDCSPALNIITLTALTASDGVIIPLTAQFMALDGMAQLLKTISQVKKRTNKALEIFGVLVTMYDSRRSMDNNIITAIQQRLPDKLFSTYIKNNVKLAEAPTFGQDIFLYEPKSKGAECYSRVADEIIERSARR